MQINTIPSRNTLNRNTSDRNTSDRNTSDRNTSDRNTSDRNTLEDGLFEFEIPKRNARIRSIQEMVAMGPIRFSSEAIRPSSSKVVDGSAIQRRSDQDDPTDQDNRTFKGRRELYHGE